MILTSQAVGNKTNEVKMTLTELCAPIKIWFVYNNTKNDEMFKNSTSWKVTLQYKKRKLTTPFHTGSKIKEPTADGVLYCLISDVQSVEQSSGFEDWATSLGFDTDSRKAEKIYNQCCDFVPKVRQFLGDDFDSFAKACEDY